MSRATARLTSTCTSICRDQTNQSPKRGGRDTSTSSSTWPAGSESSISCSTDTRDTDHSTTASTPHEAQPLLLMRLLLNIIWFVLAGLWMAIAYAIAALICFVLIITIPFGIASLRIATFALWPFGKTVVKRSDAGIASAIGNVIWFILCGWWLAIGHLITGAVLCLTIIGIPLGLASFKLIPVSLLPMGRDIVSIEQARAQGLAAT